LHNGLKGHKLALHQLVSAGLAADAAIRSKGMISMAWKGARNTEIERLHSEGASYAALARQFDLSPSRVSQIIANTRRMRRRLQTGLDAPLQHTT